jgi:alpha-glucoside transport system substrate-binding protein
MRTTNARRSVASLALLLTAGLTVAACGEEEGSGSAGDTSPGEGESECAGLTEFGELSGKTVKLYTSIVAPEDKSQKDSYQLFSDCTGATVAYEGSNEFEAQLVVRVQHGNPPDIAYVPSPDCSRRWSPTPRRSLRRRPRSGRTPTSSSARTGRPTGRSPASSTPRLWART